MRFSDLPKWGIRVPVYIILWALALHALDKLPLAFLFAQR